MQASQYWRKIVAFSTLPTNSVRNTNSHFTTCCHHLPSVLSNKESTLTFYATVDSQTGYLSCFQFAPILHLLSGNRFKYLVKCNARPSELCVSVSSKECWCTGIQKLKYVYEFIKHYTQHMQQQSRVKCSFAINLLDRNHNPFAVQHLYVKKY